MQFQHPELLYALILLVIPLIVHLFRLRKFQKEDFTNVKFLKQAIQETRKSAKLKKFLILCTRLLLLACLILAFAQPFIPSKKISKEDSKVLIYLDNSLSMQARINGSSLLASAVNDLYENLNNERTYSLITNSREFYEVSGSELKQEIQNIDFTSEKIDFSGLNLKAGSFFRNSTFKNELVIISDFQSNLSEVKNDSLERNFVITNILLKNANRNNIKIDSVYLENIDPENFNLSVKISANYEASPTSVSVYDGEQLLGRNSANFETGEQQLLNFRLNQDSITNGIVELEDSNIAYDNKIFFSLTRKSPVQIGIIGDAPSNYLNRIFTKPEFDIKSYSPNQIDFDVFSNANLLILNEAKNISASLKTNIENTISNGASLIFIPASTSENSNNFGFNFGNKASGQKLITTINYESPLLRDIFDEQTQNFEYPSVQENLQLRGGRSILQFSDNASFLSARDNVYAFSAPINSNNSNFQNCPLIVPIFYKIGLEALAQPKIYYSLGIENTIDVPVKINNDEVLEISNGEENLIPQQRNYNHKVQISTEQLNLKPGTYKVLQKDLPVGRISMNYDRTESELPYLDMSEFNSTKIHETVDDYFSKMKADTEITSLWKWFVIFALIFLGIETLLLKFFK
ncbi:BatA domain-containing protein [Gramella sp. AN32]|uniref:BatA domain-containing protein n=1 Tax=Christiangramia antarctica TaxID=2058158 RepID=A0ABW5X9F9_9FLAO|nr:BatA domain-containing protein [Gramella sp. AN32]MCM4157435.1 hypothetical protein [Gramella sp. AN32]